MAQKNIHSDGKLIFKLDREKPWFSWLLIVFLYWAAWPLALCLLLYKLFSNDPKKSQQIPPPLGPNSPYAGMEFQRRIVYQQAELAMKTPDQNQKTAKNLILVGAAACVLVILWAANQILHLGGPEQAGLNELLRAAAILVGGAAMIISGRGMLAGLKRYANTVEVIGEKEAVDVDMISRKLNHGHAQVRKDLEAMIDRGYFDGKAYLNIELDYLFRTSTADTQFVQARIMAKRAKAPLREVNKGYGEIMEKILKIKECIQDPDIAGKIERLEFITGKIFRAVNKDADKARMLERFLTYYLPVTQKLLDAYADLVAAGAAGAEEKERLVVSMDAIVAGFERQLDRLYKGGEEEEEQGVRTNDVMTKGSSTESKK